VARFQTDLGALALLVLLLAPTSCGPQDVNQLRQNYTAELNSWFIVEAPGAAQAMITVEGEADEEMSGETEGDGGESGEEMPDEMAETLTISQKITLDILLQHNGAGELPVVTLDLSQVDADGNEKQNWRLPVDASDLVGVEQITKSLEGVVVAPGDKFAVAVRSYVPPEEQSEYQEFATQPSPSP